MKRIFSLTLAILLLSLSILTLAACGGISGTYVSESGLFTYEFTSRELTKSDGYTEFQTVYSYEIEKNGSNRYIFLTLKEYVYDGEDAAVIAYVDAANKALEGKTAEPEKLFFAEGADGTLTVGSLKFVKQD